MPKVEANQSKRQEVIAEKPGLTGSEIHSSLLFHFRLTIQQILKINIFFALSVDSEIINNVGFTSD